MDAPLLLTEGIEYDSRCGVRYSDSINRYFVW